MALKRLKPLHHPRQGILRVVGLMSGSGTNLRKIIEYQEKLRQKEGKYLYQVVAIFSDSWQSRAVEIGKDYDLPVLIHDLKAFYQKLNAPRTDLKLREKFDQMTVEMLKPFKAKVAAYAGYMSLATKPLIQAFLGVNVHPADLSIPGEKKGTRRWTGAHAVLDQILAGEKFLRSTTHLIEPACDMGKIFLISKPLPVQIPQGADLSDQAQIQKIADANQELLKQFGDWVIFPKTLEEIARGNFQIDSQGKFYYRGKPIPNGIKLEELEELEQTN